MMREVLDEPVGPAVPQLGDVTPDANGYPEVGDATARRSQRPASQALDRVDRHPRHVHQGSARVRAAGDARQPQRRRRIGREQQPLEEQTI